MRRGSSSDAAAALVRAILATRDERARTAHDVAAKTDAEQLPNRVRSLLINRRAHAMRARRIGYREWQDETQELRATG